MAPSGRGPLHQVPDRHVGALRLRDLEGELKTAAQRAALIT